MAKLPISDFLTQRLKEYDPKFEVRKGTGFAQLFFNPLQFMIQPLVDEADQLTIAQSLLRILQQPDPDAFSEEAVDALVSNFFVTRAPGSVSSGVARVYYANPVDREWPANGASFTGSNGKQYTNPAPYVISKVAMSMQIENGSYYADMPVVSVDLGEDTALEVGGIISLDNDSAVISVTNLLPLTGGYPRETNTQLIERTRRSIAVRDLVTGKGFAATLFENFVGFLTELQPIGFGDDEMMRDIVYNTHIGGKVDGFFKTSKISQGFKNFVGLLTDSTRQAYSSTNIQLYGVMPTITPDANFDISNGKNPIVEQVKSATIARYLSPVDLTNPVNLSVANRSKITINGVSHEVLLSGSIPSTTTRPEIINKINKAFGYLVAFSVGTSFELRSPTKGVTSEIRIEEPSVPGSSALMSVFGLSAPSAFFGAGPIVFIEGVHYMADAGAGSITRMVGSMIVSDGGMPYLTGEISGTTFSDPAVDIFLDVEVNDIITINPMAGDLWDQISNNASHRRDFRVLGKIDNNTLTIDASVASASAVPYIIRRTGIKDGETVYVQYWYNPLSIDIGPLVKLDSTGKVRGIRPGREDFTITDVSFLRINSIEIIDPITFEPTGELLVSAGGFGQGGFGEGPFGVGGGSDYRLVVSSPTERFSAFEDSFIVFHPGLIGLSFRVDYDYVPECISLHDFVRSSTERVLDGDILMKHFLPAYVGGTITYQVDATDSTIPDNDTLTDLLKNFINQQPAGSDLVISEIYQFLARTTDPYDRYKTSIRPFSLEAVIHNTDGTTTIISSDDRLVVPTPSPFPKETTRPLSPRITHWVGDNITLVRES